MIARKDGNLVGAIGPGLHNDLHLQHHHYTLSSSTPSLHQHYTPSLHNHLHVHHHEQHAFKPHSTEYKVAGTQVIGLTAGHGVSLSRQGLVGRAVDDSAMSEVMPPGAMWLEVPCSAALAPGGAASVSAPCLTVLNLLGVAGLGLSSFSTYINR